MNNLDNIYFLKQPQNEESHSKGVALFEPYQIAAMQRLIGDYFFRVGTLDKAQKYYTDSIGMNDKDYKSWLSFAKFNESIYLIKKDEVSLQHVLKGYMSAISYALHKSRFIIPNLFQIIKKKVDLSP
jgi:catechol-2,3-dioxygenase